MRIFPRCENVGKNDNPKINYIKERYKIYEQTTLCLQAVSGSSVVADELCY